MAQTEFIVLFMIFIYMHKVIEVLKHELCFTRRCLQLLGGIREKKKLLAWKLITGLRLIKMTSHFCNIKGKYIGLHYLFLVFGTHFILNVLSGVQRKLEMANQNQVSLGSIFVVLGFLFSSSCCCLFFFPLNSDLLYICVCAGPHTCMCYVVCGGILAEEYF